MSKQQHEIPTFFSTFEYLLANGGGVYATYLQTAVADYTKKEQTLQQEIQRGMGIRQQMVAAGASLTQEINARRAFVSQYRDQVLGGQRATNQAERLKEQDANRFIVTALEQQAELGKKIAGVDQRISQVQGLLAAHQATRAEIDMRVSSLQTLQAGMGERLKKIQKDLLRLEIAAEAAAAVAAPVQTPLGGLTLEGEQIKECRALKFLSAMYIRYCHITRLPRRQLTSAQRVNNSEGTFNTRRAQKAQSRSSSRSGVGLKRKATARLRASALRANVTRRHRKNYKKKMLAKVRAMNEETPE